MIAVVVSILVAVFLFGAALAATLVVLQRIVPMRIARRHATLEEILDTRRPPSAWGEQRGRQLAKLRRLRRYVATSTLVESEELRADILIQLDSIRDAWSMEPAGTTADLMEPTEGQSAQDTHHRED